MKLLVKNVTYKHSAFWKFVCSEICILAYRYLHVYMAICSFLCVEYPSVILIAPTLRSGSNSRCPTFGNICSAILQCAVTDRMSGHQFVLFHLQWTHVEVVTQ